VLSERFGVSVTAVNNRLRRVEAAGLVVLDGSVPGVARAVHLSSEGRRRIGARVPASVRPGVQREHELAVARLVSHLERADAEDLVVFTEREGRQRQRELGIAHSWQVVGSTGRMDQRWPDLVIEQRGRRTAVELELAPKPSKRLESILAGFLTSQDLDRLQVFARGDALTHRITRLASRLDWSQPPRIRVREWRS
jgi:hypothetical protein